MARAIIGGRPRHLGGWRPSPLKMRGIRPSGIDLAALPRRVRIEGVPTDYDQGDTSSCGPNTVAELYEHDYPGVKFSRLFLYFFVRATEGDLFEDGGVTIPELISVAHNMGMPLERTWPFVPENVILPPPIGALVEANKHRVERSDLVADLDHLLVELAGGQPVVLGFGVPRSMQNDECARTGVVNVPGPGDDRIGGHCVLAFGFDLDKRLVRTTSHYGADFGDVGTLLLPFDHWTAGNVADMTAIRSIS